MKAPIQVMRKGTLHYSQAFGTANSTSLAINVDPLMPVRLALYCSSMSCRNYNTSPRLRAGPIAMAPKKTCCLEPTI